METNYFSSLKKEKKGGGAKGKGREGNKREGKGTERKRREGRVKKKKINFNILRFQKYRDTSHHEILLCKMRGLRIESVNAWLDYRSQVVIK